MKNATIFQDAIKDKTVIDVNVDILSFPSNHFKMTCAKIIPIVINGVAEAMIGLTNFEVSSEDAQILSQVMATIWGNFINEGKKFIQERTTVNHLSNASYRIKR